MMLSARQLQSLTDDFIKSVWLSGVENSLLFISLSTVHQRDDKTPKEPKGF